MLLFQILGFFATEIYLEGVSGQLTGIMFDFLGMNLNLNEGGTGILGPSGADNHFISEAAVKVFMGNMWIKGQFLCDPLRNNPKCIFL